MQILGVHGLRDGGVEQHDVGVTADGNRALFGEQAKAFRGRGRGEFDKAVERSLSLELQGLTTTVTTPSIYALGTVTTRVLFIGMAVALAASRRLKPRP